VTRALAVIGLLTFGLSRAAALAKAPQSGKSAPQHRAAAVHKKSTEAAHAKPPAKRHTTTARKAKTIRGRPAAHKKTTRSHTHPASHRTKTAKHHRPLRELIATHAAHYGVPQHLVRRVIAAESDYNPKARNGPYVGLMQIALATARGLGYRGDAAGLTDPDTNLRYGVAYLANAYRIAHGDEDKAVRLYRRGYYYEAKRQGMIGELIAAR
jgi:soluble lytic murein transglycosylase-like protein